MAPPSLLLPPGHPRSRAAIVRHWLTGTFSGRAIALGAVVKLVAFALTLMVGASPAFEALDTVGDFGLVAGALVIGYQLFVESKRRLLWRVRRKLTLSYIFMGFVPALLIITFFLLCGVLLFTNLSAHLMTTRIRELQAQTELLAQGAAASVSDASGADLQSLLAERQRVAAERYPGVSYAVLPAPNPCAPDRPAGGEPPAPLLAGPWTHASPPPVPGWIGCDGYAGLLDYRDEQRGSEERAPLRLMVRALAWPRDGTDVAAIVDIPVGDEVTRQLLRDTSVELMSVGDSTASTIDTTLSSEPQGGNLFRRRFSWVAFLEWRDWNTGAAQNPQSVGIRSSIAELYSRIMPAESFEQVDQLTFGQILLFLVAVVGVLFLVIQLVAFAMGLGLARSITGAVHELFEGTERVRRGDFSGEIAVRSRDQMGQLAESFNEMTASIEDLLREKAEKERLEQELLIARRIQMSLLPQGAMSLPGLSLTAHCEPAREVGGDYYDFLPIDDHTIGILIADVSGKGTSAALYMAELKGIVLSLSQRHTSPRELLIEADRIISRHLDSRSFITVSYLLVDLHARTLRYARAGHCPMIYMPGPYARPREPQLLTPDGLVLGLQLDEGRTFTRLLVEMTLPLGTGDLFVLYTDGMSEAMNVHGDFFGDARLADVVGAHADLPAEEIRERILRDLEVFAGSAPQHDDMTMVLLRVDDMAVA